MSLLEVRQKYAEFVNADAALVESRRWIEVVTSKRFKTKDFRESLADGILLCELLERIGIPVGRVNRATAAYAGIDNLNLFLKGCEYLGLKRLHLFDVNDLQDVFRQRRSSIASRAKESQKRLQNVAITIFWLEKVARRQGFRGPILHQNCFKHLLPEPYSQNRRKSADSSQIHVNGSRKRHSFHENFLTSASPGQTNSLTREDKILSQLSIQDKKEKFQQIEQEAIRAANHRREIYSRRKSTGSSLLGRDKFIVDERRNRAMTDMSENGRFFSHADQNTEMESRELEVKTRMRTRGSSSTDSGVTSPPPISLGSRAKVDLRGKQKFFEEREKATGEAAPSARVRPKSWGPGEMERLARRKEASFKDKHLKYEQLQRQADTESATLQGKIRPQRSVDRNDGPPKHKGVLPNRVDVQLGDKRRKFESLDHQAQKDSAVLRGEQRITTTDGKKVRRQSYGNGDSKLRNKQEMFESLERQASEDMETLQGKRPLSTSDREHNKRASGVFLPKEADVSLGDKKGKFEELDRQAKKESNILRFNQSRSTGSLAQEPGRSYENYYRPRDEIPSSSNKDAFPGAEDGHGDFSYQKSDHMAPSIKDIHTWQAVEEPMECAPDTSDGSPSDQGYWGRRSPRRTEVIPPTEEEAPQKPLGRTALFTRQKYGQDIDNIDFDDLLPPFDFSDQIEPEIESVAETPPEPEAPRSSFYDPVEAPLKEERAAAPLRRDPSTEDVAYKPQRGPKNQTRVTDENERPYSGAFSYSDYVSAPKGGSQRKQKYLEELKRENGPADMPWRQEVRELKGGPQREEIIAPRNEKRIPTKKADNPPRLTASQRRDAYLRELERDKAGGHGVQEMPWRQELKELPPREEERVREEIPGSVVQQSPNDVDIRKMTYRDFAIAPHRSVKRGAFVSQELDDDKAAEEMPWRQELRALKDRPPAEEPIEPASENVNESAYDSGEVKFSYRDFVPMKQGSLNRNEFLRGDEKPKEEMPWRQEVKELRKYSSASKEYLPDNEHIPDTADSPSMRKLSYRDFSQPPSNRNRAAFVNEPETASEEMPWRAEVRELRNRGPWEGIEDDEREERKRDRPKPKSSSTIDGRKLSYHDFVCPPSMMNRGDSLEEGGENRPKNSAAKKRYKVQDLTRKFTEIEADQTRPKQKGVPSPKSLVNKEELERIEREMKTRTWHGFPSGYSEYENRRGSLPDEDTHLYRPADISADDFRDVFEDPEVLFQKEDSPVDVYREPVPQGNLPSTDRVDRDYEGNVSSLGGRQDGAPRFAYDEPGQRPSDRSQALEYPPRGHEAGQPSFHGDGRYPLTYRQPPEREHIRPQETPALNSMPQQPVVPEQSLPVKARGHDAPRGSTKNRTIYLWSSEDSQVPPVQQFDQINLNTAPTNSDEKDEDVIETRDWAPRESARNGRMPMQYREQQPEDVRKDVPSNGPSDTKERPLRIRSNVFAIVGNTSQGPRPYNSPHRSVDQNGVPNRAQKDGARDRDTNRAPRPTQPRVVDINGDEPEGTRNASEGYPYGKREAGGEEKANGREIPGNSHGSQQMHLKTQLRDADYRAKLRSEMMDTNRRQREGAKYLLSQVQASYSSDGGESEESGNFNSTTDGSADGNRSRYPEVNEREQLIDRLYGSSEPNSREGEKATGEGAETRARQWDPPRKLNPDEVVDEPVIEPSEKPAQTFSLDEELAVIFRQDADPYARLAELEKESETYRAPHDDRYEPSNRPGPSRNRAYPKTKEEMSNGYHRYDANHNTERNGYGGHAYPEQDGYPQRNGYNEKRKAKPTIRAWEQPPQEGNNAGQGRHSMQYAPVEFKPNTKGHYATRNGPLTNGYPRHQTRPKMEDPGANEEAKAKQHPNRNGLPAYNIYETFVHGESNHVVCEFCGTTIEKSPSMFVAEVNKYWHLHCFQCVVCQELFNERSGPLLRITDSRLHCERCFITDEGERCTEV